MINATAAVVAVSAVPVPVVGKIAATAVVAVSPAATALMRAAVVVAVVAVAVVNPPEEATGAITAALKAEP